MVRCSSSKMKKLRWEHKHDERWSNIIKYDIIFSLQRLTPCESPCSRHCGRPQNPKKNQKKNANVEKRDPKPKKTWCRFTGAGRNLPKLLSTNVASRLQRLLDEAPGGLNFNYSLCSFTGLPSIELRGLCQWTCFVLYLKNLWISS